jgi:hypothetical protein
MPVADRDVPEMIGVLDEDVYLAPTIGRDGLARRLDCAPRTAPEQFREVEQRV